MNWEVKKLEGVSDKIGDGLHSTPNYVEDSDFYFINGNNLINGKIKINNTTKCISEAEYYKHRKDLNDQTLLISINGTIGNIAFYNNEKVILGKSAAYITCNHNILKTYLFYLLQSKKIKEYFESELTGTTIRNLSLKSIRNTPILLLPISDQQKIASILDAADDLRQKDKALIAKYNELTKSLFLDMFGNPISNSKAWNETILDKLGELKSGGTPSRSNPEYFEGNIPWITTVALGNKLIDKKDAVEFITEKAIAESATKLIPKGSIMIGTRVGVGKASILGCDMCSNQDILSLINLKEEKINKNFLLDIFGYYENYFNSKKRGATIQGITSSTIKELKIILPPIELQNQFTQHLELIEKQKQLAEASLKKSEELFNSLLDKAFKGELTEHTGQSPIHGIHENGLLLTK